LGGCAGLVRRTGVEHRPESERNQWFARNPAEAPKSARAKSCPAAHRSGRGVGLGIAWEHPRVWVVSRAAHGRVIDSTRARLCRPMAVAELRCGWRVSGRRKGGRVPAPPLPGSASRAPPSASQTLPVRGCGDAKSRSGGPMVDPVPSRAKPKYLAKRRFSAPRHNLVHLMTWQSGRSEGIDRGRRIKALHTSEAYGV
jgi:hypothetical protein